MGPQDGATIPEYLLLLAAAAIVLLMVAVALDHPFLERLNPEVEVLGRVIQR